MVISFDIFKVQQPVHENMPRPTFVMPMWAFDQFIVTPAGVLNSVVCKASHWLDDKGFQIFWDANNGVAD